MLLATGLQWASLESIIHSKNIYWCRLTASDFRKLQIDDMSYEDRKLIFDKNEIDLLYKAIRSQKTLSPLQKKLAYCIAPDCNRNELH